MAIKRTRKKAAASVPQVEFSEKKTPAKKTPAKKKSAAKKTTGPAKKKATKKAASAKAPKKTAAKGGNATGRSLPRDLNEHGFVKGSNSEKIVDAMLAGGESRQAIADDLRKKITGQNGQEVNTPALMSGLLHKLEAKGYKVESSWKLLPPTPASKAAATKRAKKAATKKK